MTRLNEWDLGPMPRWRTAIMTQAERKADFYRSRWSWRNPNGRGTRSSMRDRTWHDIKPRSKALLSPPRSRCLLGPHRHQQAARAPRFPPSRQNSKAAASALTSQSHGKVKVKSLWETNGREENKSFLNVFVVQKTGVVIFFELVLSNVWCSEWPKPWREVRLL